MSDFVRLLTVAVLSFALVGGALVYSRDSDALTRVVDFVSDRLTSGDGGTATTADDQPEPTRLWISRPERDTWMGLAGFPDQYALRFPIPAGVTYENGRLELAFDAQLTENGDGRLTIAVGGVRRGEIVLNHGRQTHEVNIELGPDDLLGRSLEVLLSGIGTTNSGQICPTNAANSGSAITLLPSSGLALYTFDPVDSPRIRLASLAEPIRVDLGETASDQAAALWGAQALARAGIATQLVQNEPADVAISPLGGRAVAFDGDGALVLAGQAGLDDLIAARSALLDPPSLPHAWPVSAQALGAETTARNFRGSRRWSLPYRIADLDGGRMPTHFDLALRPSVLAGNADWVVRVALNGNLLKTGRFGASTELITMPVELPIDKQGLRNEIIVELIDTSPNDSICRTGPDAQAQLLPETILSADGVQPATGWGAMVRTLAQMDAVGLGVEAGLSAADALDARAMLASFIPARADIVFGDDASRARVKVTVLRAAQLQTSLRLARTLEIQTRKNGGGALVFTGGEQGNEPMLLPLDDPRIEDEINALSPATTVLMVSRN
ncbi:MAG TPA: hypothetical protein VNS12_04270 [Pelagibacterium sp.]|uniref:hypothetical protein n=1 Tax=Pelagibacterium sp. TaxID=1967288 RepID=UPI002C5FE570|nr:hypothetical protein [Pelagibacterium sp.]HWJ87266.1 hypothetical protein [Pelagibacterium sp.]